MGKKADNETARQRVEFIYRLILQGWTPPLIVQNVAQKWGLERRQVYYYISRAQERIKEQAEKYRAEAFEIHLMARAELRRDASQGGDKRLVLDILRDEAKFLGLYAPEKSEQVGPVVLKVVYEGTDDPPENPAPRAA